MATFLVTYDIRKERSSTDRDQLREAIKSYNSYAYISDSTYVIESYQSAKAIHSWLRQYLDNDDYLFVFELMELDSSWHGRGKSESIDWLKDQLSD